MQLKNIFNLRKKSASSEAFYPITFGGNFRTGTRVDCKTKSGQLNAYINCPPVSTLITSKATALNNARWWFGREDGSISSNQSTRLLQDLFERPNKYQSWNRFVSNAYVFNQLFGKAYIYIERPVGMARRYATSMLVMPNTCVTELYNGSVISKYLVNLAGRTFEVMPEDMMVWNDFTFSINDTYGYMDGMSRLYSCSDPVNTIIAAYEAANVMLTNYGMMGIISPDTSNTIGGITVPMTDEKKKDVQDDLQRRYGIMRDQWPLLITGQPVKYTAVGRPLKDLMLLELVQDSTRQLSEAFKYPFHLLGFTAGTTFTNVEASEKRMYNDAIIPEANGFIETFNRYFENTSDNSLRCSFDHLPALQANRVENETALKTAVERLKIEVESGLTTLADAQNELENLK